MTIYTLFASCPRGLEAVLQTELAAQGCSGFKVTDGGVAFKGSLEQIYLANLYSRTASRVLLQLTKGSYRNEQDIYKLAYNIDWHQWFGVGNGFKVKVEGKRARVKSLNFVGLKIKDAICDSFRSSVGERPSVDKKKPDVRIHTFVGEQDIQIFIDTSGEALFKRGYRYDVGEAPLRENLAAGLLLLAGYDGTQPFQDPFCGSGTIAIEAAWIGLNRAPGLLRHFGFEQLKNFDKPLWVKLKQNARNLEKKQLPSSISASDYNHHMIQLAEKNAQAADLGDVIDFSVLNVENVSPNGNNGIMVTNPPYGVRMEDQESLRIIYPQLGTWLKKHYAGWLIGLFTGDRDMPKLMRLQPKRKLPLYNGNLDCRLFLLDMVRGSNR